MKHELLERLAASLDYARPPLPQGSAEASGDACAMLISPLLSMANGFVTKQRAFRVFGTEGDNIVPSLRSWNASEWKQNYGAFADWLYFFAEDIFGNQYSFKHNKDDSEVLRFACEGGEIRRLKGGLEELVAAFADPSDSDLLDWPLIEAAFQQDLRPGPNEHLAFELPLISGGAYGISNLTTEDIDLHLGVLSQLTVQIAASKAGAPIRKFSIE